MTRRSTPNGRAIAARTRELARALAEARVRYWASLLARPQLCAPIVWAVKLEVETGGWDQRLAVLVRLARRKVETRRVADAQRYERACLRAAEWLSLQDLDCKVANACTDAIALWSGRRLPPGHRWAGERICPPRTYSQTWRRYWQGVEHGRRERERLRNAIVTLNEGLVIHYVQSRGQWMIRDGENGRSSLDRSDLQQHAREGLMVAANRYDPEKKAPRTGGLIQFSTYATWWMRHHVDRAYQQGAAQIRVPLATQVLAYKVSRLLDRWPDAGPEQLAMRLWSSRKNATPWPQLEPKVRAREVERAAEALTCIGWHYASLDAPMGHQEGRALTFADMTPDQAVHGDERRGFSRVPAAWLDEQLDQDRVLVRMLAMLDGLDPEARDVVGAAFGFDGEPQTLAQIARRRQIPRERVEQIHHRALATMRAHLETARP